MLSELIEALQIFLKYGNIKYPTHCGHDEMIVNVNRSKISEEDIKTLNKLGFIATEEGAFKSFKFGSS